MLYGHTSIQSPHSVHLSGLKEILFRLTTLPSTTLSISEIVKAPSGQAVVHAPQRVHIAYDASASVLMSPGTCIPVFVTTLIASVGHILAHAPI